MTDPKIRVWWWGVRETPDFDDLRAIVAEMTDGKVHVHNAVTHSDEYAYVFSLRPLTEEEGTQAYLDRWGDDDD